MTIFQILQVFHASLCPLGHGGLYETLPPKKGIVFRWLYGFLFHNTIHYRYKL